MFIVLLPQSAQVELLVIVELLGNAPIIFDRQGIIEADDALDRVKPMVAGPSQENYEQQIKSDFKGSGGPGASTGTRFCRRQVRISLAQVKTITR